jgi:DNA polymerase
MRLKKLYTDYWQLLDHLEDAVRGEFRETHPEAPPFPEPVSAPAPEITTAVRGTEILPLTESAPFFLPDICRRCGISLIKKRPVAGRGSDNPKLVVVLDPPSAAAEKAGIPLVPEEEEFVIKWVGAIGLDYKKDVYLTNVIKCRPPGNRPPFPDESSCCLKYLDRELEALRPRLLLAAGETAGKLLTKLDAPIAVLRKTTHRYRDIFLMVTWPPSQVLYDERLKRPVWEDLKILKGQLDGPIL